MNTVKKYKYGKFVVLSMAPDKVKILGISGSPRKNGHTQILINEALSAAKKRKM